MNLKNGDLAAFSIQASDAQGSMYAEIGLTKREYFAVQLMAAPLSTAGAFSVRWLCRKHHDEHHLQERRRGKN